MSKIALITGATAGIGEAVAYTLAKEGFDLIITGRRASLLTTLSGELERGFDIRTLPLAFDVRDVSQVEHYLANLPAEWSGVELLINNAGLAVGLNPIDRGVLDDWERMIDTNIKGLLYVTRVISSGMVERGSGHIINIGSIAGKSVYLNGNVYCATKFAVDALSKGMMMDLNEKGIKVSQVCPGAVETEFSKVRFKGDEEKAANVYRGFEPLTAADVAEMVRYIVMAPEHVNISEVVIMPKAQASPNMIRREP